MISIFQCSVLLWLITGSVFGQISDRSFPQNFSFGAATAAYQIEGAWNEDSKGETIWDYSIHRHPSDIIDNSTADIACDSYHKYAEDISNAVKLGLQHYKFSISWSRILPTGFSNQKNMKGIKYYQTIVSELEKNNITPVVTLYHWDLPESLQDIGGWTNIDIVEYFKDYAEVVFESLPSVKNWITINEPKQVCVGGYGKASMAPFINVSGEADYLCAHHVILAHASVYHLYQKQFASKYKGKISIGLDGAWNIPASDSQEDKDAAERRLLFDFGLYAHPLFFGDWPDLVKERVQQRSLNESFSSSRLPNFTDQEKITINGTLDFLTINYYDTKLVANDDEASYNSTSYNNDLRVVISVNSSWGVAIDGNTIYPDGLRSFLKWVQNTYNNPEIFIGENGIADDGSKIEDDDRIYYLADYLSAVLESIYDDNMTITGYTMWSLMDNFEWTKGYSLHYGLYAVNFTDPERTRTPKKSVDYYKNLITSRKIPDRPPTSPAPTTTPTTTPPPSPSPEPGSAYRHSMGSTVVIVSVTFSFLLLNF